MRETIHKSLLRCIWEEVCLRKHVKKGYCLSSLYCETVWANSNVASGHASLLLVGRSSLLLEKLHCFKTITLLKKVLIHTTNCCLMCS